MKQQLAFVCLAIVFSFAAFTPLPIVPHALVHNALNCTYMVLNDGAVAKYSNVMSFGNSTFPTCPEMQEIIPYPIENLKVCAMGTPPQYFNTLNTDHGIAIETVLPGYQYGDYFSFLNTTFGSSNTTLNTVYPFPGAEGNGLTHLYCRNNPSDLTQSAQVADGTSCYQSPWILYANTYCRYQYSFCFVNSRCLVSGVVQETHFYHLTEFLPSAFPMSDISFTLL